MRLHYSRCKSHVIRALPQVSWKSISHIGFYNRPSAGPLLVAIVQVLVKYWMITWAQYCWQVVLTQSFYPIICQWWPSIGWQKPWSIVALAECWFRCNCWRPYMDNSCAKETAIPLSAEDFCFLAFMNSGIDFRSNFPDNQSYMGVFNHDVTLR